MTTEFVAFVKDQMAPLGPIVSRRMFSGAGLYCDGVIFALILRGTLYFKVDAGNRAAYQAEGLSPFSYQANGRTVEIGSYWRAPERLFDDTDEMVDWARAALAAGRRAEALKKAAKPRQKKSGHDAPKKPATAQTKKPARAGVRKQRRT
jgi:DNA transformation protein and related proteins